MFYNWKKVFFGVIKFVLLVIYYIHIIFIGIYHFFLAVLACISSTQLVYTVEKTDTCTEMEVSFWWLQNKKTSKMKQKSVYMEAKCVVMGDVMESRALEQSTWRLICIF